MLGFDGVVLLVEHKIPLEEAPSNRTGIKTTDSLGKGSHLNCFQLAEQQCLHVNTDDPVFYSLFIFFVC